MRVVINLTADVVFLVVQPGLLAARDMAAVAARVAPFMMADELVFMMETGRLRCSDPAFVEIAVDAQILMREAMVHLDAPRMVGLPWRGRRARHAAKRQSGTDDGDQNFLRETHYRLLCHDGPGNSGLVGRDYGKAALNFR